mmetsp:Transcript_80709/g.159903  ORF Transcript_80709/g.159903 Transcript_80709/m.159903 type:complete len:212 (+) Transcript_80709:1723-2358(+)
MQGQEALADHPHSSQERHVLVLLLHTTGDRAAETSPLLMLPRLARHECPIHQCQRGRVPQVMLDTRLEYHLPKGALLEAGPAGVMLWEAAHGALDLVVAGPTQLVTWDPVLTVRYHPGVGQERRPSQRDQGYKAMLVGAGRDQPLLGVPEAVVQLVAMHTQRAAVRLDGHRRLRAVAATMMTLVPWALALSKCLAVQGRHHGTSCKKCCGH